MSASPFSRLPWRVVAGSGSVLIGLLLVGLSVAALAVGHGEFSGGVGVALLVYASVMIVAGVALGRGRLLGRGPVIATALLNVVVAWSFTGTAPWAWLVVAICAMTAVAAALPATSRTLRGPGAAAGDSE